MRAVAATLPRIALRAPRIALALPPRWRLRLVLLALASAALGALYVGWLRDSSLVRVERVSVSGLDTPDAPRVQAELASAARNMTTLHVDMSALRAAVRDEPIVRSLDVRSDFPHGLRIEVVENRPVAMLTAGGRRIPVAPDGTLLPGARTSGSVPSIQLHALPEGARLDSASVKRLVALAAAAPPALLRHVDSVSRQQAHGLVARLDRGPAIWFGGPANLELKWQAAAAVLAQRSSAGASYVDVRLPTRPVAGGLTIADPGQPLAQTASGSPSGAPATIPASPDTTTAAGTASTQQPQQQQPTTSGPQAVTPAGPGPVTATPTAGSTSSTNAQP